MTMPATPFPWWSATMVVLGLLTVAGLVWAYFLPNRFHARMVAVRVVPKDHKHGFRMRRAVGCHHLARCARLAKHLRRALVWEILATRNAPRSNQHALAFAEMLRQNGYWRWLRRYALDNEGRDWTSSERAALLVWLSEAHRRLGEAEAAERRLEQARRVDAGVVVVELGIKRAAPRLFDDPSVA